MADRRNGGVRDAIDEKLVSLLCQNARMTLTALARELALSRTALQARMARLERDKVIVGYRAVLGDLSGAGEDNSLGAVLSITFSQRPCFPVVEKFRHWPEITNYYSVTGPLDAYVVVKVNNARDLSQLVDRLSAIAGVDQVRSAVVLKAECS
ncbi:DNA-binding Lrp family transcriptional regulator [Caulobacter ginsengisoli]|uniref:DNA-binding Lrp family transcriptional regulator n=1 Tax=Caulobacter ginsengisoli TaxID=400775 RepID=A0ABU0ILK8_9CAUL|nr:Lrp/AsnC family transcriptional regulator [Caulobacter ginsengisoli]MDQ0462892.1 DNA-binding Lrp family transcriptional regulator [Caulobacter ginsengisoli]